MDSSWVLGWPLKSPATPGFPNAPQAKGPNEPLWVLCQGGLYVPLLRKRTI